MRIAVLDDYHRVFEDDRAVKRLRERTTVDVFTEKVPSLEQLRGYTALIALRERTRFDAAFFEAVPGLGDRGVNDGLRQRIQLSTAPDSSAAARQLDQLNLSRDYLPKADPLNDELGHHRILRTSPLTEAPAAC